jgi:hypothetical protein
MNVMGNGDGGGDEMGEGVYVDERESCSHEKFALVLRSKCA